MRLKKAVLSLAVAAMVCMVCMTNLGSMSSLDAAENETVAYGVVSFDAETGVETYEEISFPAQRSAVEVMERAEICVNNELSSAIPENSVEFDVGFDENTIAAFAG